MEKNARSLVSKIDIKTAGYFTIILLLLVFGTNWGQTGVNWWHEVAIFALLSLLAQLQLFSGFCAGFNINSFVWSANCYYNEICG